MIQDGAQLVSSNLDTCEWEGNVGWMLVALGRLQQSGFYDDPSGLKNSLDRGAAWVVEQIGRQVPNGFPDIIRRASKAIFQPTSDSWQRAGNKKLLDSEMRFSSQHGRT